jgi:hypothetical protein
MASYLDQYGAGDVRRIRIVKLLAIALVAVLVVGGIVAYLLHTRRQEQQVKLFFDLLARQDYQTAYGLWVRTESDRQGYPYNAFMQDWGPQAVPLGKVEVLDGESCGSGVLVHVDTGKSGSKRLWVERDDLVIAFPPPGMERCPKRNRIADWLRRIKYRMHGRTYE